MEQSYRRVASAVIAQAVKDAELPLFNGKKRDWDPKRRIFVEKICVRSFVARAIDFLCQPSDDLAFWCQVADVDMKAVIDASLEKFRHKRYQLASLRPKLKYVA